MRWVESGGDAESYTGFRALPITIKRIIAVCLRTYVGIQYAAASVDHIHRNTDYPLSRVMTAMRRLHAFSANSVGVLPVTCRKAWENAGTLA